LRETSFDTQEDHVILPFNRKLLFSFGGLGDAIIGNGVIGAGTLYSLALKLDPLTVGIIAVIPRLWDAVTDPFMGHISDNTRTRWGRRRPYVLFGGISAALIFFILMCPPASLGDRGTLVYFFVTLMFYYTAYTVFSVPYSALGFEMSIDYHERTRVMAFRAFCVAIGGMIAGFAMWITFNRIFPSPRVGMGATGLLFAAIASISFVVAALGTREAAETQKQDKLDLLRAFKYTMTNGQFLLLVGALAMYVLGLYVTLPVYTWINSYYVFHGDLAAAGKLEMIRSTIYAVLMLGTIFPLTWLGTRLGKRQTLALALLFAVIGTSSTWFMFTPKAPYLQLLMPVALACALPAVQIFPMSIMADICDLDELKTGLRREGLYGASFGFVIKLAGSMTLFLTGVILRVAGIDQTARVQTPEALLKLRVLGALVPAIMLGIAGILLFRLNVPESKVREVRAILEQRRKWCRGAPLRSPKPKELA
jgi:GPH family glycoside/pentoside/hexuronide:cation symporter